MNPKRCRVCGKPTPPEDAGLCRKCRRPRMAAVALLLLAALPAAAQTANKEVKLQVVENKVVACDFCVTLIDELVTSPDATVWLGQKGLNDDASCNATTKVCTPPHFVASTEVVDVPTNGLCDHQQVTNGRIKITIDPTDAMNKNGYQLEVCASDTEGGYHCCDGKVFVENTRLFSTIP